jgi:aspartate oxidase
MENEKIIINNFTISYYRINTLIVGSGVASLNAAVNLHSMGQEVPQTMPDQTNRHIISFH